MQDFLRQATSNFDSGNFHEFEISKPAKLPNIDGAQTRSSKVHGDVPDDEITSQGDSKITVLKERER